MLDVSSYGQVRQEVRVILRELIGVDTDGEVEQQELRRGEVF